MVGFTVVFRLSLQNTVKNCKTGAFQNKSASSDEFLPVSQPGHYVADCHLAQPGQLRAIPPLTRLF